ncbi:hypothetical protein EV207_12047 [Scopulibacillus darangshiensis]|uniref:Glycosyltransferase involved in cell wall biosynthesis n=1 Tax=Scopulibacillus darangshiensis TaxID=442528 RepID=A0A4R2NVA2_9BACL|nr:glycosyltransferase [Scopulibacillus darangshiensis]TCP26013.1 hypothetical protein EV207_12047 [Scopulibacillus darangshiensis]
MKILHLIGGKEIAGSKNHLISLLDRCSRSEIFLGVFEKGEIYDEAVKLGINVREFNQKTRYDLSVINKIKRLIKSEAIDIVHTHGPRANLYGYVVNKIIPFIWATTVHSDPRYDFIGRGVMGWGFTKVNIHVLKRVDHYFAISNRFRETLVQLGAEKHKITTVYNGITFDEQLPPALAREDLGLDQDDFVMTTVGRLHPIKGHKYLISAMGRLTMDGCKAKLLIIGDGPLKKELENEVKSWGLESHIIFLGHQQDVDSFYGLSDIKVLPSLSESFPLVILEAARARLPVIATDVGGVSDMMSKPDYGWVVPPRDEDALMDAIKEAMARKADGTLKNYGQKLYRIASKNYSLNQLVEDIRHTYEYLKKGV